MKNGPYELIVAPPGYPGKKYRGRYAYEHVVVWWKETGEIPPPGFVIHHKNEKKRDNRFSNLALMSNAGHVSHHAKVAEMVELNCKTCGGTFSREARDVRSRAKAGYKNSYCCRSCQVRDQQRMRWHSGGYYNRQ